MVASNDGLIAKLPSSIFRHKKLLLSIFVGVLALVVLYLVVAKKQYASSMTIAVQNTRATQEVSSVAASPQGSGSSADELESHVNSEVELLTSDDILQHLVLFRSAMLRDGAAPAPGSVEMSLATARLSRRIEIDPVKKSAIIDVTYRDYTPQLAQAVLQQLEQEYLKKHVLLQRAAGTSDFFGRETDSAVSQRRQAEQTLADFQAANGFVSLDKEKDLLAVSLDQAKGAVLQDSVDLASITNQVNDLKRRLVSTPSRLLTSQRTSPNQYVLQQLVSQMTELKNRRITLSLRYVSTDRVVQEVDQQIASTQATIDAVNNSVEKTEDNNPSWLAMDLQLKTQQVALAGAAARLGKHQSEAQFYNDRLSHLQAITATNNQLEARAREAVANQQGLTEKRDAARVDDLLDQGRFGNVAVALSPTFSYAVVKPQKVLDIALGLLTAIFLCVTAAVILELSRDTMFTPGELEAMVGIPVLATVPETYAVRV